MMIKLGISNHDNSIETFKNLYRENGISTNKINSLSYICL